MCIFAYIFLHMKTIIVFIVAFTCTILFVVHNEHGKKEKLYNTALAIAAIFVYEIITSLLNYFT